MVGKMSERWNKLRLFSFHFSLTLNLLLISSHFRVESQFLLCVVQKQKKKLKRLFFVSRISLKVSVIWRQKWEYKQVNEKVAHPQFLSSSSWNFKFFKCMNFNCSNRFLRDILMLKIAMMNDIRGYSRCGIRKFQVNSKSVRPICRNDRNHREWVILKWISVVLNSKTFEKYLQNVS